MKRVFTEETKARMRANHADFRGCNHPQWKGGLVEAKCAYCGKTVKKTQCSIKAHKLHFCNPTCHSLWQIGKPPPNKGRPMSLEQKQKLSKAMKGRPSAFRGNHHTPESKEKLRQGHLGKPLSEEHKAKIRESCKGVNSGENNPMYGTVAWNRGMHPRDWLKNIAYDELLRRVAEGSARKPTSLEQRFIDIIKQYDIPFRYVGDGQIWINGLCPDFINCNGKKQLIEVFGNYWHQPEDEEQRKRHFARYGFNTLVLWEDDIKAMSGLEIVKRIEAWEA